MKNILVVDDENLIRYSLASMLHGAERAVKTVGNGADALSEINVHFYDLCFLDLHLPDMHGLDIMKTIKDVSPETRIIIMTASDVDNATMQLIQENASLFLSKPFDLEMVRKSVEHILEHEGAVYSNGAQASRNHGSFITWLTDDKRQCERTFAAKTLTFSTDTMPDRTGAGATFDAEVFDISDCGMGMMTSLPLSPGHVIMFSTDKEQAAGVVRWSMIVNQGRGYRVGVQFIKPGETAARSGRLAGRS